MAARLLIVEDDKAVLAMLEAAVQYGGFESKAAATGHEAIRAMAEDGFDAVLLDLGLPDAKGEDLLLELRKMTTAPILVVSGWATEQVKIKMLDLGADDFVEKPFLPGELLARIRAAIRRYSIASGATDAERLPVLVGSLVLDPLDRTVRIGEQTVHLSEAEYRVLARLAAQPGTVVSRADILKEFYGADERPQTKVLNVYISRIRAKLRQLSPDRELINSKRGAGWTLVADI